MAGKITLTFNQEAVSGNTIVVNIDDGTVINALSERFAPTRWESGIADLPLNNNSKEKSAEAYAQLLVWITCCWEVLPILLQQVAVILLL